MAPLLALVLALSGLVFLAGCTVNVGLDTQVETDGSGTVSVRLAADQELQDALSGVGEEPGGPRLVARHLRGTWRLDRDPGERR